MCTPLTSDWFLAAVAESPPGGMVVNFTVGFPLVLKVVPPRKRNSTNLTIVKTIIETMFDVQMNNHCACLKSIKQIIVVSKKMERNP